jgi:Flp pilus assembly protein TadG
MPKPFLCRLQKLLSALARVDAVAGIEFGLFVPVLAMLTVCTIDLGGAAYDAMQVENAAQAGAQYASVHGYNVTSISNAITSATSLSGLTVSPAPTEFCGCPSAGGITSATCQSTCSDGSIAGVYVTASATATYTTLIHYPAIPPSFTFVNKATARIQ